MKQLLDVVLRGSVVEELIRSIGQLGAIGRNLNQIARAANQGDRVVGLTREELMALLRACEARSYPRVGGGQSSQLGDES